MSGINPETVKVGEKVRKGRDVYTVTGKTLDHVVMKDDNGMRRYIGLDRDDFWGKAKRA